MPGEERAWARRGDWSDSGKPARGTPPPSSAVSPNTPDGGPPPAAPPPRAGVGHAVQEPLHLRAGEVGVQQQAGALAEERLQAAGAQLLADGGGAPVLPDHGVRYRLAFAVPDEGGLAL